jgi:hypothetical protein
MKKFIPGVKFLRHIALFVATLAALMFPAAAQARTYEVFTVDVPFKFNIASRTFQPGQYQFVLTGPGLLALRDGNGRFIASLITRSVKTGAPSTTSKLVFDHHKKNAQLIRLCLENRSQALEIMGEQFAMRSEPFPATIVIPGAITPSIETLFEGHLSKGLKQ